jgi:lipoyl-dependent peroxiredoxin
VTWQGNLMKGSGTFDLASSGTMTGAQVTFARRIGNPEGSTSPEELIAAAHASCYAMALSNTLGEQGNDPEELNISATCTLDTDSLKITTMVLDIRGNVPGVDEEGFRSAAEQAEQICPVSNALRGNVDIQLNTSLA